MELTIGTFGIKYNTLTLRLPSVHQEIFSYQSAIIRGLNQHRFSIDTK